MKKALWTKLAEMTKTCQEHQVPLLKQVIILLDELKSIQPELGGSGQVKSDTSMERFCTFCSKLLRDKYPSIECNRT